MIVHDDGVMKSLGTMNMSSALILHLKPPNRNECMVYYTHVGGDGSVVDGGGGGGDSVGCGDC